MCVEKFRVAEKALCFYVNTRNILKPIRRRTDGSVNLKAVVINMQQNVHGTAITDLTIKLRMSTVLKVLDDGSVCGQLCVSSNHLKQHMRGMHGEGWVSLCGKKYQWPGTMYSHQQSCDQV